MVEANMPVGEVHQYGHLKLQWKIIFTEAEFDTAGMTACRLHRCPVCGGQLHHIPEGDMYCPGDRIILADRVVG